MSWNSESDTYGGSVTYRVFHNGVELTSAPGQSGTTYSVTGAIADDVFSVEAEDASGNISGASDYVFQVPIPLNVFSTTYPAVKVEGVDLGGISQIDDLTYKFIKVPNIRRPVTVTLHSPYSNSEIRYTLNGKNPNPSSHLYVGPLVYTQNGSGSERTTIKARVYDKRNANNKSKIIRIEFRVV